MLMWYKTFYINLHIYPFTHSLTNSFILSYNHSLTHLLKYTHAHSLTYPFTHKFIHTLKKRRMREGGGSLWCSGEWTDDTQCSVLFISLYVTNPMMSIPLISFHKGLYIIFRRYLNVLAIALTSAPGQVVAITSLRCSPCSPWRRLRPMKLDYSSFRCCLTLFCGVSIHRYLSSIKRWLYGHNVWLWIVCCVAAKDIRGCATRNGSFWIRSLRN